MVSVSACRRPAGRLTDAMGHRARLASWIALLLCVSARGQCPGGWQPGFGGTSPADVVFTSEVFDDGSVTSLFDGNS